MSEWKIKSSEYTEENPKFYKVTDDPWECECIGFEIRKHCRHIEEAKKKKDGDYEEVSSTETTNHQASADDPEKEVFKEAIEDEREKLLDLSNRNRLLNFKFPRSKCVRFIDEIPDILFKKLLEKQVLIFDPVPQPKQKDLKKYYEKLKKEPEKEKEGKKIKPPKAEEWAKNIGINTNYELPENLDLKNQQKHQDKKIQTLYYEKDLVRALRQVEQEAKRMEQEKGINMLYVAFGFLEYYDEKDKEKSISAPLILLPTKLKKNLQEKFELTFSDEDVDINLSLVEKLRVEHNLKIPDFILSNKEKPKGVDDYFNQINKLIEKKPEWRVQKQVALSFFAFKYAVLYNDLDPNKNPNILNHSILNNLLTKVSGDDKLTITQSDEIMDEYENKPIEVPAPLVMPADSSQHNAILKVLNGENMVIKGPPGTGKSQTIANIIAAGLKMGKKILFVAEKTAALQVVKKRLDKVGLGEYCFELHTDKLQKSQIADSLKRRLEKKQISNIDNYENVLNELGNSRKNLNVVNNWLHQGEGKESKPFHIIGRYEKTKKRLSENLKNNLEELNFNNPENLKLEVLKEIFQKFEETKKKVSKYKPLKKHPWSFVKKNQKVFDITKYLKECLNILNKFDSSNKIEIPNLKKSLIFIKENSEQINTYNDRNFFNENISKLIHDLSKDTNEFNKKNKKMSGIFKLDLKKAQDIGAIEKALIIKKEKKEGFLKKLLNPKDEFANLTSFYNKITKETQLIKIDVSKAKRDLKQLINFLKEKEIFKKEKKYEVLGEDYKGLDTDVTKIEKKFLKHQYILEKFGEVVGLKKAKDILKNKEIDFLKLKDFLTVSNDLDFPIEDLSLKEIKDRYSQIIKKENEGHEWVAYLYAKDKIKEVGCDEVANFISDKSNRIKDVSDVLDYLISFKQLDEVKNNIPDKILEIDLTQERNKFKEYNKEYLFLSPKIISNAKLKGPRPPFGRSGRKVSDLTEWQLIVQQLGLVNPFRNLALRQLVKRASKTLQTLQPVCIATPYAIAQAIPYNSMEFDIVLIDEASQLKPEVAYGAVARGKQLVVVGDEKQLPPTTFYETAYDDDEEEETITTGVESILIAAVKSYKSYLLNYHYRSRHDTLINFSNNQFYEDKLHIFPSPSTKPNELGIKFKYIKDGIFIDRKNDQEADEVVKEIINHMENNIKESLIVATMNTNQRDLIQEKFNMAIEGNSKVQFYLNKWEKDNTEIFSIKNLENVQGDERDVIFISFTYGKHPDAKVVRQYFGPITWDNGWRRLNVLYTRARKRIVAFSSMKPSDVKLTEGKKGTAALHHYLHYAQTGELPKVGDVTKQNRGPDSDFEIAVADEVRKLKYDVTYQVGSAGYFVDIGVVDPFNKNNYILGIEADGEQYHSSRSARDRDITRQEILESLGWKIHRVWGPDWLKDSEKETRKIKDAIKEEIDKRKVIHKEQAIRTKQEKVILENAQKQLEQDKIELETDTEKKYIFSQDDARNELLKLKKIIMKETNVQESKCILRDKILNLITEPGTSIFSWTDFQNKVPMEEREKTNPDQFKYKDEIIKITSKVLE